MTTICCLFPWPVQLVCSQGKPEILGHVDKRKIGGEGLYDPLGTGSERKGRPQQVS